MSIGSSPFQGGGSASIADATESTAGKIRIATTSESDTGTNDTTAMTPAKVKARIDAALVGGVEYKGSYTGQSLVTAEQGDLYVSAATYSLAGVQVLSGDHIIFNQNAADPVTSTMFDKIDNTDQVSSVNTETGAVVLSGANLDGDHSPSNYSAITDKIEKHLEGIDTALGARQPLDAQLTDVAGLTPTNNHVIVGDNSNFTAAQLASTQLSDSADLARLASPALTGTPTAPTATSGTNTTQLATTAFVQAAVTSSGSSDTLDTVTGRGATTSNAVQVGGLNIAGSYALPTSDGSAGQILKTDGSGALTFQSLGSISTQAANSVNITGGAISGITDLAIADGGTGASTEAQARTNLGLAIGSDVQAHDAGLDSISGLTTAADKMLYTTGSDTYAVTSLTAAGRALLDDADAAAQQATLGLGTAATKDVGTSANNVVELDGSSRLPAVDGSLLTGITATDSTKLAIANNLSDLNNAGTARTNLGLAIGSDVQAHDAGLDSISGLTTAADKMIYTTGSDTYAVTGLTSAGRALLDDADAAAQRTTLGLVIGTDVLSDVVQDTSPQLGGNLDLNGQDIVSTSNADLDLAPDGTGVVSIKGNTTGGNNQGALKLNCEQNSHFVQIKSPSHSSLSSGGSYTLTLPPDDGDANQVLKTDGSGVLDWVDQASGGGTIPDVVVAGNAGNVSAAFASAGSNGENERVYLINNSSTARTVTLPATSGNSGKKLQVKRLGTANVTIAVQAGETLETTTDGTFILSAQFSSVTLVCNASGSLDGWYII